MAIESWNHRDNGDTLSGWILASVDFTDGKEFAIELAGGLALAGVSAAVFAAASLM